MVREPMFCPAAPKSNGMIVQPSTVRPLAAARLIMLESGPVRSLGNVTYTTIPGLLALMVFSASIVRCWSVPLEYTLPSMSMSSAFRPYALITAWYAPASAPALPQDCSSQLPDAPPEDTTTSPPAARMLLMVVWSTPPVSGRLPSHCGLQVPLDSMNAIVNHLTPVADITVRGSGGLPQPS